MAQIASSEEQLRQGRDEVIHLQNRIRCIIDQIKAIDANANGKDKSAHAS